MADQIKSWRCVVCGYIHQGNEPPDECPVCGAPKSEFEPVEGEVPAVIPTKAARWICLDCGYIHEGSEPPDECPVCGSPKDRFEPLAEEGSAKGAGAASSKVVIVGAGIAGLSAAESVRRYAPQAKITLVSKEKTLPYYRLNLTRYLAGEVTEKDVWVHPKAWYDDQRIDLFLGSEVTEIVPNEHIVRTLDGKTLPYDKLILATGAHPFIPPIAGSHREGVESVRNKDDADRILSSLRSGMNCVCIGGGILGLETAGAIARHGVKITILEGFDRLMPRQLNKGAAERLKGIIEGMGMSFRLSARVKEIVGDERVSGVLLDDGTVFPADLVVITAGVRPNSYLARKSGLKVASGVIADNKLCTSHPDIFAAGDVAEHRGVLYGLWGPALFQGSIAGMNAAGAAGEFGGIPRQNSIKVLGIDFLSIGKFEAEDGSYKVVESDHEGKYYLYVFRDNLMVGCILLGDLGVGAAVKRAIEGKADFSALLAENPDAHAVSEYLRGLK